ncbi:hypothetical protein BKP64_15935 [Marinobacter salinus]|uniref:Uncharacterized protein n=1 Tax=Marinobacter salinus TaxID=1874317 RepID=A0A1D9GPL0_9GAMM|nr:hypothetical protein BKP64_15935 [Marinobacter salinus]
MKRLLIGTCIAVLLGAAAPAMADDHRSFGHPPGIQKQLDRGKALPPGHQKKQFLQAHYRRDRHDGDRRDRKKYRHHKRDRDHYSRYDRGHHHRDKGRHFHQKDRYDRHHNHQAAGQEPQVRNFAKPDPADTNGSDKAGVFGAGDLIGVHLTIGQQHSDVVAQDEQG